MQPCCVIRFPGRDEKVAKGPCALRNGWLRTAEPATAEDSRPVGVDSRYGPESRPPYLAQETVAIPPRAAQPVYCGCGSSGWGQPLSCPRKTAKALSADEILGTSVCSSDKPAYVTSCLEEIRSLHQEIGTGQSRSQIQPTERGAFRWRQSESEGSRLLQKCSISLDRRHSRHPAGGALRTSRGRHRRERREIPTISTCRPSTTSPYFLAESGA